MSKSISVSGYEFPLEVKDCDDVINSIKFDTEEERAICEDIIKTIEKNSANYIRNDRKVYIPYIGVFNINKYRIICKQNSKSIKEITKNKGAVEGKLFRNNIIRKISVSIEESDSKEKQINKSKKLNQKFYKKYAIIYGVEAAKAMLGAISKLVPINFDEETEEQLQIIYNNERDT